MSTEMFYFPVIDGVAAEVAPEIQLHHIALQGTRVSFCGVPLLHKRVFRAAPKGGRVCVDCMVGRDRYVTARELAEAAVRLSQMAATHATYQRMVENLGAEKKAAKLVVATLVQSVLPLADIGRQWAKINEEGATLTLIDQAGETIGLLAAADLKQVVTLLGDVESEDNLFALLLQEMGMTLDQVQQAAGEVGDGV